MQVKLLRVLQERKAKPVGATEELEVDVRVIAATNRDLEAEVARGAFRSDLYYRLNVIEVRLPPLRQRPEDVPLLVDHVLSRVDRGPVRHRFVPAALDLLVRHRWPFNVRELQQVVERAVCLVDGEEVRPEHLPPYLRREASAAPPVGGPPRPLREVVEEAERAHVLTTLEHTGGNKRRAIELLGISPETFYRRLEAWGLHRRDEDREEPPSGAGHEGFPSARGPVFDPRGGCFGRRTGSRFTRLRTGHLRREGDGTHVAPGEGACERRHP
jgi:DNA-binding NtrC family response regulator